jgi:hypothetical protein
VLRRERHVGEHVGLGLVEESGKLGQLGTELIGDLAPLRSAEEVSGSAVSAIKPTATQRMSAAALDRCRDSVLGAELF